MIKVGSLVAVKKIPSESIRKLVRPGSWFPVDDSKTPYVVRKIVDMEEGYAASLEEGVIQAMPPLEGEIVIFLSHLIELQPPMEIQNLVQESILQEI